MTTNPNPAGDQNLNGLDKIISLLGGGDKEADTLAPIVQEFEKELTETRPKIHYDDGLDDFGDYAPAAPPSSAPWAYGKNHAAKTTWGGARADSATPAPTTSWRRGGWSRRTGKNTTGGYGGYGGYYGDYDYGNYTRSSYSSWCSGYSSARSAMRGVHRSASGFVRDAERTDLSIYPSSSKSLPPEKFRPKTGLHVRIDASLYEDLGIEKAQQHYTVDAIGQVLALQAMPNPELVGHLQNMEGQMPRAVREIVTEVVRRRGLELLASEAPGWVTRIDAFRDAISLQERSSEDGKPISEHVKRFDALMRAAWLSSDLSDPLAPEAMGLILRLDDLLSGGGGRMAACALASEIRSWIAENEGLVKAALAIEGILPTVECEALRLQPLCPEPALPAEIAAEIKQAVTDACDLILAENCALSLKSRAGKARMAGLTFLRDPSIHPDILAIDSLTLEVSEAREQQMEIDRSCDQIRLDYEKQLRAKIDGRHSASRYLETGSLSILWAHASMEKPAMKVAAHPNASNLDAGQQAELAAVVKTLNTLRADYNKRTQELIASAQHADSIETKLSCIINGLGESQTGGLPVWVRFASTAGIECANALREILDELMGGGGGDGETDEESGTDFAPPRRGKGDGDDDDLIIDEDSKEHKKDKDNKNRSRRCLAQRHDDLIAEGVVNAEDLPQISTKGDLRNTPEIVIYNCTNPAVIAK